MFQVYMYVDVHEYVFQTSATNECYFYLVGWLAPAIIGQSADRLSAERQLYCAWVSEDVSTSLVYFVLIADDN